ncbi:glycosyltransferase family 2 protein [Flavobacterium sp. SM2513]|uniref:glycosyltransferase family 2 protein n=1 Tax=Flavobacterium sp. SM2513 TaxID=3424766 RepID=UPI003D7F9CFD
MSLKNNSIAVVIPYYNASKHIVHVVEKLPDFIDEVIIVDDKGGEKLPLDLLDAVSNSFNVIVVVNEINLGVGGATKKGFLQAILNKHDIVIKVDADDQMDTAYIEKMIDYLIDNRAEMVKGNRFIDTKALMKMPFVRRFGNLGLSFLTKAATGYWNNFDPTNGFLAVNTASLKLINFDKLSNRYFFETSLMSELYFVNARIKDISMPAIYGDEKSSMNIWKMPLLFAKKLTGLFFKRIVKQYFLFDFNICSLYLLVGLPMFFFGIGYGIYNWLYYTSIHAFTPTGTIMIVTISIILGFQLLLQAVQYDIFNAPKSI